MPNENQDLLDLCRLSQSEDNLNAAPAEDSTSMQQAIDWKQRQLANKVTYNAPTPSPEVMQRHRDEQCD